MENLRDISLTQIANKFELTVNLDGGGVCESFSPGIPVGLVAAKLRRMAARLEATAEHRTNSEP